MDTNNLANEIAAYRCTMNRLSKGKSLTHPDVIKLRQVLDILMHNYYFRVTDIRKNQHISDSACGPNANVAK